MPSGPQQTRLSRQIRAVIGIGVQFALIIAITHIAMRSGATSQRPSSSMPSKRAIFETQVLALISKNQVCGPKHHKATKLQSRQICQYFRLCRLPSFYFKQTPPTISTSALKMQFSSLKATRRERNGCSILSVSSLKQANSSHQALSSSLSVEMRQQRRQVMRPDTDITYPMASSSLQVNAFEYGLILIRQSSCLGFATLATLGLLLVLEVSYLRASSAVTVNAGDFFNEVDFG